MRKWRVLEFVLSVYVAMRSQSLRLFLIVITLIHVVATLCAVGSQIGLYYYMQRVCGAYAVQGRSQAPHLSETAGPPVARRPCPINATSVPGGG